MKRDFVQAEYRGEFDFVPDVMTDLFRDPRDDGDQSGGNIKVLQ